MDTVKYLWLLAMCPALCFGQAMTGNGTSSFVDIPYHQEFLNKSNVTIMSWVKITDFSQIRVIAALQVTPPVFTRYPIGLNLYGASAWEGKANYVGGFIGTQAGYTLWGHGIDSTDTNWHHYAITYNGVSVSGYVDGVVDGSLLANNASGNISVISNYFIGKDIIDVRFSNMTAADVRVYASTLSEKEISSIAKAYPRGSDSISRGLLWRHIGLSSAKSGDATINGDVVPDVASGNNGRCTNGVISAPSIIGNRRLK